MLKNLGKQLYKGLKCILQNPLTITERKFTKSKLFDEKMGGIMHIALFMEFPETNSQNQECAIHWDILKDMKSSDSKIIADGRVIYVAGRWLI